MFASIDAANNDYRFYGRGNKYVFIFFVSPHLLFIFLHRIDSTFLFVSDTSFCLLTFYLLFFWLHHKCQFIDRSNVRIKYPKVTQMDTWNVTRNLSLHFIICKLMRIVSVNTFSRRAALSRTTTFSIAHLTPIILSYSLWLHN